MCSVFPVPLVLTGKPIPGKNWRILQSNRCKIGTINALQCRVPVWWDSIGPRTAKNDDNYCTALKRNMGWSAHGNLVQWVNLQNRIRAGSSYSIILTALSLLPLRGAAVGRAQTILPIDWSQVCTRFSSFLILQFFRLLGLVNFRTLLFPATVPGNSPLQSPTIAWRRGWSPVSWTGSF